MCSTQKLIRCPVIVLYNGPNWIGRNLPSLTTGAGSKSSLRAVVFEKTQYDGQCPSQ
jgi:hypothetical protein